MEYSIALFFYTAALKIADACTVLGVWYLAWYLRFHSQWIPAPKGIPEFSTYSSFALPLMLVYSAIFHIVGVYRKDRLHFGFRSIKKITEGSVLGTLVFISILYFSNEVMVSRVYLALFPAIALMGLVVERGLLHAIWLFCEARWVKAKSLLLVGTGKLLEMYVQTIQKREPYPVTWIGRLGPKLAGADFSRIPYLGEEHRLQSILHENKVDWVIVSYPDEMGNRYQHIMEVLAHELVGIKVLPDFGKYSTFTYSAQDECGVPLLVFNDGPLGTTDRVIKRIEDIIGSAAFLILASPLYALIAIWIKLSSKGPVFYSQKRIGADGKIFTLYKFRSMRIDAEAQTGAVWAVENDPRVTPIGKFLRRTSLDEIPQFFNVLKGDMSLVGPRPERPFFVDQFRKEVPKYMLRHKMKSGITGWAQVQGWRGNTSIDERIKHDLYYIGHWSHRFDIKILCLTLVRGFVNRHAY